MGDLDKAQRGKHIHEETAPWVFKGSVRKEAYNSRVHFLQTNDIYVLILVRVIEVK
jgi:hypothetical protein